MGGGTDKQTDRHLNTMTQLGLRAGPSENIYIFFVLICLFLTVRKNMFEDSGLIGS